MKNKIVWLPVAVVLVVGIAFVVPRMKERIEARNGDKWVKAAVTSKNCEILEKEKPYPNSYQGALIDAHIHIPPIPDGPFREFDSDTERLIMGANVTMADYVCLMESENIKTVFAFFPVWKPIIDESLSLVKRTMDTYGERFIPFIMPPDRDDRADGFPTVEAGELGKMLKVYQKMFRGYG